MPNKQQTIKEIQEFLDSMNVIKILKEYAPDSIDDLEVTIIENVSNQAINLLWEYSSDFKNNFEILDTFTTYGLTATEIRTKCSDTMDGRKAE